MKSAEVVQKLGLRDRPGAHEDRVIAVDLYGCGKSPAWEREDPMYLDDEISLFEPVFRTAGKPFHLVGHSYGGAIALKVALEYPGLLNSLIVFEPVLFSVLVAHGPDGSAAHEIVALRDDTIRLADRGDLDAAAERFVAYWLGAGTWAATPEAPRARGRHARGETRMARDVLRTKPTRRIFSDRHPDAVPYRHEVEAFGEGGGKAAEWRSAPGARGGDRWRRAHGPVTHPNKVNPVIEGFLQELNPAVGDRRSTPGKSR